MIVDDKHVRRSGRGGAVLFMSDGITYNLLGDTKGT